MVPSNSYHPYDPVVQPNPELHKNFKPFPTCNPACNFGRFVSSAPRPLTRREIVDPGFPKAPDFGSGAVDLQTVKFLGFGLPRIGNPRGTDCRGTGLAF
jgi:hypothetical protein